MAPHTKTLAYPSDKLPIRSVDFLEILYDDFTIKHRSFWLDTNMSDLYWRGTPNFGRRISYSDRFQLSFLSYSWRRSGYCLEIGPCCFLFYPFEVTALTYSLIQREITPAVDSTSINNLRTKQPYPNFQFPVFISIIGRTFSMGPTLPPHNLVLITFVNMHFNQVTCVCAQRYQRGVYRKL